MNKKCEKLKKNQSHSTAMSMKTKEFLKRICYKETVSVDMTRNGFIKDSKEHISKFLDKPLNNVSLKPDQCIAAKKDKMSHNIANRKQIFESNGDKNIGIKIIRTKHQLKPVYVPKINTTNILAQGSPQKMRKV